MDVAYHILQQKQSPHIHSNPYEDPIQDLFRQSLSIGLNGDGARPQLVCAARRVVNRCRSCHAWCLRRVWISLIAPDDSDAMGAPIH